MQQIYKHIYIYIFITWIPSNTFFNFSIGNSLWSVFLWEVQDHCSENKMTLPNLATVFSPSILIPKVRLRSLSLPFQLCCATRPSHLLVPSRISQIFLCWWKARRQSTPSLWCLWAVPQRSLLGCHRSWALGDVRMHSGALSLLSLSTTISYSSC